MNVSFLKILGIVKFENRSNQIQSIEIFCADKITCDNGNQRKIAFSFQRRYDVDEYSLSPSKKFVMLVHHKQKVSLKFDNQKTKCFESFIQTTSYYFCLRILYYFFNSLTRILLAIQQGLRLFQTSKTLFIIHINVLFIHKNQLQKRHFIHRRQYLVNKM